MIQLTKDLWMDADEYQYIVGTLNKKRCNSVQEGCKANKLLRQKYYPTAAQAVSAALSMTMRKGVADGSITTLREFIQEQDRPRAEMEKLMTQLE